jgi:Fic family protein
LALLPTEFNHRQIGLLQDAMRRPDATYTVQTHATTHNVVLQTARQDLMDLEDRGLFVRELAGRQFTWRPVPGLAAVLRR